MKTNLKRGISCLKSMLKRVYTDRRFMAVVATVLMFGTRMMFAATDPFATATGTIRGYKESVQSLLYAIAAVIALVGAFNVYHKMTNGDQDVKKTIMLTLGGCIAMVALSVALPAFFD